MQTARLEREFAPLQSVLSASRRATQETAELVARLKVSRRNVAQALSETRDVSSGVREAILELLQQVPAKRALYWYKSTNADAILLLLQQEQAAPLAISICTFVPVKQVN